jgi:osmotically-inducible protein OsmY
MMFVVATAAATLMVGGCDRPGANQPGPVGLRSDNARVAKLTEKSVDQITVERSVERSAQMDRLAGMDRSEGAGKSPGAGTPPRTVATAVAARGDASINGKVSSALIADPRLKSTNINVDTEEGIVTLSGNVDTVDMRLVAKEVAARQPGVAAVIDNIAVRARG